MKEKELIEQVQELELRIKNIRSILADYPNLLTAEERINIALETLDKGTMHPMFV